MPHPSDPSSPCGQAPHTLGMCQTNPRDRLPAPRDFRRWASLHPTVPAPQVPAQDRGSRDMPVPDSSASSCRCYGCRPIRRRHGAGSCRGSSTTVSCMRCRARHTRRFSFFHPHVTQSSNPLLEPKRLCFVMHHVIASGLVVQPCDRPNIYVNRTSRINVVSHINHPFPAGRLRQRNAQTL